MSMKIFHCATRLPKQKGLVHQDMIHPPHLGDLNSDHGLAIPAAVYRSAQGPGPESAPRSAFCVLLGTCLRVPQRGCVCVRECFLALLGLKNAKKHSLGHCEAGAQKHSKKHSVGHFPARAPEHSCKWRPGSQPWSETMG